MICEFADGHDKNRHPHQFVMAHLNRYGGRDVCHMARPPPPVMEMFIREQAGFSGGRPPALTPSTLTQPSLLLHLCMICTSDGPKCTFHNSCLLYCSDSKAPQYQPPPLCCSQRVGLLRVTLTLVEWPPVTPGGYNTSCSWSANPFLE